MLQQKISRPALAFSIAAFCLPLLAMIIGTIFGQGQRLTDGLTGGMILFTMLGWIYALIRAQSGNDYLEALIGEQDSVLILVVILLFLWVLIFVDFANWTGKTTYAKFCAGLRFVRDQTQKARWRLSDLWFRATGM